MNLRLYLQTLRWNRVRLAAVVVAALGWGMVIPIVYVQFAEAFKDLANSGVFPKELMNFGSGSLFTLPGALTLGLQHPLAIAFVGIFAVGSTVSAIAGERESGTLEVLLSRPISRRTVYVTLAYLLLNYFLEILGSLWRDVAWSQQYSLFHHFNPGKILTGETYPIDFLILAVAIVIPVVYALVVFPRRDLAAPA